MLTCMSDPSLCAVGSAAKDALREFVGEMLLVDDRASLIRTGVAALGGQPTRLGDRLVSEILAQQILFGFRGAAMVRANGRQSDADIGDPVAVEHQEGAGRRDRPVTGPPLDLLVGAAGARPDRQSHLDQHLRVLQHRFVRADR